MRTASGKCTLGSRFVGDVGDGESWLQLPEALDVKCELLRRVVGMLVLWGGPLVDVGCGGGMVGCRGRAGGEGEEELWQVWCTVMVVMLSGQDMWCDGG